MDTEDDIPEDELFAVPAPQVAGGVARLWAIRSNAAHERQLDELLLELSGGTARHLLISPEKDPREQERRAAQHRRAQAEAEHALRDLADRQNRLLAQIADRQLENDRRRQEIADHALRLGNRLVYVDGNRYRDEQGRVLTGTDAAEAARQHAGHPDAATWAAKTEADREAEDLRRLHDKIIQDREQGTPQAAARLTGYEQEFAAKVATRQQAASPLDYGSADYMADYGDTYQISSRPAFTEAAIASRETIGQPSETETQSAAAAMKKAPRPLGQGALKLG